MNRRDFILTATTATAAAAQDARSASRKGKLRQAVCAGVFGRGVALEDRCRIAAKLGVVGHDLVGPKDWPTLKKYGLVPTMATGSGTGIAVGMNRTEHHE